MDRNKEQPEGTSSRRSFLGRGLALGAGAVGAGLLFDGLPAFAQEDSGGITRGDIAILRFLSAAEIIETDLWRQYNELAGIPDSEVSGGTVVPAYQTAILKMDQDMPQYIHDNTEDEISHFTFINAYLMSKGAAPVNLDKYRTMKNTSKVTGASQVPRLTSLMQLTVDTTWWTRYRSRTGNPDLGDSFAPAVKGLLQGKFPAIPRNDNDLAGSTPSMPSDHLQAIANTAGFHFGFIEQGGTSLYPQLAQRVTSPEVLRILLSIGPTETAHFQTWHDKVGNAPKVTDPTNGLAFPDLNNDPGFGGEDFTTNLIMPEPTKFLNRSFPAVSIIRPTQTENAAMAAVKSFTDDGLFINQSAEFFAVLRELAEAADAARRGEN